jgi:hypothetical protein
MPAALTFHTLLAVTGFMRNQQDVRSPGLLGLALNASAIIVVVTCARRSSPPWLHKTHARPDHTMIERALADTPLATWRDAIALRADAMRVISAPPAA